MSVPPIYISWGRAKPDHVLPSFIENGAPPHLFGRGAPAACSDVAGVMGWIDGWASRHNPLRSLSGAGRYHDPLRRCCFFCAVMGTRQRFPFAATRVRNQDARSTYRTIGAVISAHLRCCQVFFINHGLGLVIGALRPLLLGVEHRG